jgi:two-component system, NarL family, nitrate/nitrite response regulator NarL
MAPVAVTIVSADPLVRSGLAARLSGLSELAVSAQVAPGADLPGAMAANRPWAVLWDLGGQEQQERLREAAAAGLPVVALVASVEQARAALALGARGLLFRDETPERLGAALLSVSRGLWAIDEALAPALLRPQATAPEEPLTPRESQVLALLSEGLSNKIIAQRLGVSEHTAKFHVNAILAKLGAGSRSEAIVRAARAGLVVL